MTKKEIYHSQCIKQVVIRKYVATIFSQVLSLLMSAQREVHNLLTNCDLDLITEKLHKATNKRLYQTNCFFAQSRFLAQKVEELHKTTLCQVGLTFISKLGEEILLVTFILKLLKLRKYVATLYCFFVIR